MDYQLSAQRIAAPAQDNEALLNSQEAVRGYNMRIVDDALDALTNSQVQLRALSMFSHGLREFAHTMPTETDTLADHDPHELGEKVIKAGPQGFAFWFGEQMNNHYDVFRDGVVGRNLYHYFEQMARLDMDVAAALTGMEAEFAHVNYATPTQWVSRFFNGLQMCVFEAYVVDQFVK